jgi:CBS domain-containing protein
MGILTERDLLKAIGSGRDGRAGIDEWMTRDPEVGGSGRVDRRRSDPDDPGRFSSSARARGAIVGIVSIRDLMRDRPRGQIAPGRLSDSTLSGTSEASQQQANCLSGKVLPESSF